MKSFQKHLVKDLLEPAGLNLFDLGVATGTWEGDWNDVVTEGVYPTEEMVERLGDLSQHLNKRAGVKYNPSWQSTSKVDRFTLVTKKFPTTGSLLVRPVEDLKGFLQEKQAFTVDVVMKAAAKGPVEARDFLLSEGFYPQLEKRISGGKDYIWRWNPLHYVKSGISRNRAIKVDNYFNVTVNKSDTFIILSDFYRERVDYVTASRSELKFSDFLESLNLGSSTFTTRSDAISILLSEFGWQQKGKNEWVRQG